MKGFVSETGAGYCLCGFSSHPEHETPARGLQGCGAGRLCGQGPQGWLGHGLRQKRDFLPTSSLGS